MRRGMSVLSLIAAMAISLAHAGEPQAEPATQGQPPAAARPFTYPYLKPEECPAKAKEALDPAADEKARSRAVWELAVSRYCPESGEALAAIASDSKNSLQMRIDAGMGLWSFTAAMPDDVRAAIQRRLRQSLRAEKDKLPEEVLRVLIRWGDADLVREVLGEKLHVLYIEIEVLEQISARDQAVARLTEMHRAAAPVNTEAGWSLRWRIGSALINLHDKLGVDILIECLTADAPIAPEGLSPAAKESQAASFRQSLHSTFMRLAEVFDEDFGYGSGSTWKSRLNDAIPKMVDWWKANRQKWSFEEAISVVAPKIQAGSPLTKRQARVLAAKLANEAFATRTFAHANGKPVGKIQIAPEGFNDVRQENGRWILRIVVPRGAEAFVNFLLDGTDAKVTVNYAWR